MNLQQFDYEEAKKDPERVRFENGETPRWVEFVRECVLIKWPHSGIIAYEGSRDFDLLRLTPKPPETVNVWFVRSGPNDAWRPCDYAPAGWDGRGPVEVTVPEE